MNKTDKLQALDYGKLATIYHESSHFLIATYNYFMVYNLSISMSIDEFGSISYYKPALVEIEDFDLQTICDLLEIQISYAGLVGEKIYYKGISGSSRFPNHLKSGSKEDIATAQDLIRKSKLATPGKKTSLLKKQAQKQVEDVLTNFWDDIRLIAHSLYRRKRFNFEELKYLLTRKSINKEFWKERYKLIKIIYNKPGVSDEIIKNILVENTKY